MIIYFANRQMKVLGHATTNLRKGYVITEDLKTEDVDTGVASFSCRVGFTEENRLALEEMTNAGNYLLRSNGDENEFYTIIDSEVDTRNKDIYIYAEDAGLDLLNEIAGEFEAPEKHNAEWYINKYILDSGFEIGINEIPSNIERKLKWEGESTVTARLASIATQFGGYEISFSFAIKGLAITNKYVNIHKERGKDNGVQLRLNKEIDRIITAKSVANLATAFRCEGGVPDKAEEPITFSSEGYTWSDDDDDFYIDGDLLKSKKANEKWSRYVWNKEPNKLTNGEGYIVRPYSYDTTDPATLRAHAVTELKKVCDMEVNYEVDIKKLPEGVRIGDRINIVDDAGEMYVSTRVLLLESSVVDQKYSATLGEHLIKKSGISQKIADLAAEFAKTSQSAARALAVANTAHTAATEAQGQTTAAAESAAAANTAAGEAQKAAVAAAQSAATAEAKASAAEAAAGKVERSVASIEQTVEKAQKAAENAQQAAKTAEAEAEKAAAAAGNAAKDAFDAKTAAGEAKTASESAVDKAGTAIDQAGKAKEAAEAASDVAQAAKLDSEQAKKDVKAFEESLETVKTTMKADYARKTDLTETTAELQFGIEKNAAGIAQTASKLVVIDETANDAQKLLMGAVKWAETAEATASQANAEAKAAQAAANEAAQAAASAQSEADTAKAAADTAQSVADKAEADLKAAEEDLATVQSREDATEEEIAAAQAAVNAAKTAADTAKTEAEGAAQIAAEAQATADTAVTNATNARIAAEAAAGKATLAQQTAEQAKGDATAAQARAEEAVGIAEEAQRIADTAVQNATTAQATANQAAAAAANAQRTATAAAEKAAQAQIDLDAATQNLADVLAKVDATEEEVAAAQEEVTRAQTAASAANQAATAAQAAANTAQANATAAQADADNAKTAADNANQALAEAQAAVESAKAEVDGLVVRTRAAETRIEQTNEEISLKASKKEVESIQVGGRNLIRNTFEPITTTAPDNNDYQYLTFIPTVPLEKGQQYTISADVETLAGVISEISVKLYDAELQKQYAEVRPIINNGHIEATFQPVSGLEERLLLYAGVAGSTSGNSVTFSNIKFEKGTKATDWTHAPEDLLEDIGAAEAKAQDAIKNIVEAQAQIQLLADSISQLVRSGDSGTLLKQDSTGLYYFDISNIQNSLNNATSGLDTLEGVVLDANGQIDVLKSTAAALTERTEYVRSYTDENDQPCLELGEGDSTFKVRITNTEIQFEESGAIPARINRQMLIIEKTIIKNELQFGDDEEVDGVWIWKRRSNGNLGLMWKEVNN